MHISEHGLALICKFEGFSPVAYRCPAGWWTIGYGHVLAAGDACLALTEAEARRLLTQDVAVAEQAVQQLISVPLNPGQWDALVSFTFNLGAGALQRSALRRKVNGQLHAEAPAEFMRWVFAGGRKLPGLIRRRAAEAALYELHTTVT